MTYLSGFLLRIYEPHIYEIYMYDHVPSDICAQRSLGSTCASTASTQPDQSSLGTLCSAKDPKCYRGWGRALKADLRTCPNRAPDQEGIEMYSFLFSPQKGGVGTH